MPFARLCMQMAFSLASFEMVQGNVVHRSHAQFKVFCIDDYPKPGFLGWNVTLIY